MPLRIVWDDKGAIFRPAVICDHCGQEITEGTDGNYEWLMDGSNIKDGVIYFTHKRCCFPFEQAHGGRSGWFSEELYLLPLFLGNNLKIDPRKAKELARL